MAIPNIPELQNSLSSGRLDRQVQYPNKIFSLAEQYIPKTQKELFVFCEYFFRTNPTLNQAIRKAAAYPITDLAYEDTDEKTEEAYNDLFTSWDLRKKLIEMGIYWYVYGNVFLSINIVPTRYLKCPDCDARIPARTFMEQENFRWLRFRFHGKCIECGKTGDQEVVDIKTKRAKFVRLVIWDPNHIEIEFNPITDEKNYIYNLPNALKNKILMGDKSTLNSTPIEFIDAVREKSNVRINPENIFHFGRPGLSATDGGWGMPAPVPALQDLFYRGLLRRAQEAIANDHILPLRLLYPQAGSHSQIDLSSFKNNMEAELKEWRKDPNRLVTAPIPVGIEQAFGSARALSVAPELAQVDQNIVIGCGFITEWVYGGISWSGSSVSLRMLENEFKNYRENIEEFLQFVTGFVGSFLGWSKPEIRLTEFKMADDALRRDFMFKLNTMEKISDQTMLDELDWDASTEAKQIRKEMLEKYDNMVLSQKLQARAQGEAQLELNQYQRKMQEQMQADAGYPPGQEPGAMGGDPNQQGAQGNGEQGQYQPPQEQQYADPMAMAQAHAEELRGFSSEDQQLILQQIQDEQPTYYDILSEVLSSEAQPEGEQRQGKRQKPTI